MNYFPHVKSLHIKNAHLKHWNIISIIAYSRTKILSDMLVRSRLEKGDDEDNTSVHDSRPGSPTLHMLEDLEMESKGLEEFFTSHSDQSENDFSQNLQS